MNIFFFSLIIVPIGRYLGIRETQRKVIYNPHLEKVYKNGKSIDEKQMTVSIFPSPTNAFSTCVKSRKSDRNTNVIHLFCFFFVFSVVYLY